MDGHRRCRGQTAIDHLGGSQLAWGTGRCDFAVNRRANKEAEVPDLRRRLALQGPVDHDVPVLQGHAGRRALSSRSSSVTPAIARSSISTKFCGDYAGFAQIELETRHPGAQAMFVAGCGGDQNPIPRRALDLAVRYGKQLAESVEGVLRGRSRPIDGPIVTVVRRDRARLRHRCPPKRQIERDTRSDNFYIASRAKHLLEIDREPGQARLDVSLSGRRPGGWAI